MNKGRICVPVCAKTTGEMLELIERAAEFADVIELRFDYLNEDELDAAIKQVAALDVGKLLLATFRPKEQGGFREIKLAERLKFWEKLFWTFKGRDLLTDFEADLQLSLDLDSDGRIVSHHDFETTPDNLVGTTYDLLSITNARVIKVACHADSICDSLGVWKLLERGKKPLIPIAMGEAGKWTRILGLAHGAFMTYASLDDESANAPGQISARDMRDLYRVKELTPATRVYGIIGGNTAYSRSPRLHNEAFKQAGLDAVYIPLQVADLDEFMRRMVLPATREVELNFHGFSVTIPHKEAIMRFLDEVDETARAIGAVNTVKIENGKLYGYNTDAEGFIRPLIETYGDVRGARVALLGAGGAARACVYALKKAGAEVTVFARNLDKAKALGEEFGVTFSQLPITNYQLPDTDILVNTTPVGMTGKSEGESPVPAESLRGLKLVYDIVYVPEVTRLLSDAREQGVREINGMAMLLEQAAAQRKFWFTQR